MGAVQSAVCIPRRVDISSGKRPSSGETTFVAPVELIHRSLVSPDSFSITDDSELGSGTFGRVSLSLAHSEVCPSVVRFVAIKRGLKDTMEHSSLKLERNILSSLDHPSLVKLYGVMSTEEDGNSMFLCQILEYCPGGELFTLISKNGPLAESTARLYFGHIMTGLNYLHTVVKAVHRDLKPENILISHDGRVAKLCDFGTAVVLCDTVRKATGRIGSLSYAAPEVYSESRADFSSDVWSAGVVLYVMFCASSPFRNSGDRDQSVAVERVKRGEINKSRDRWKSMAPKPKRLIGKMMKVDEFERLTASQVLQDDWLQIKAELSPVQKAEVQQGMDAFLDSEFQHWWLALAHQIEWEYGSIIFRKLDTRGCGIVYSEDLRASTICINHHNKDWWSYSEIIAALLLSNNTPRDEETCRIVAEGIPFAYDALKSVGYVDLPNKFEIFAKQFEQIFRHRHTSITN